MAFPPLPPNEPDQRTRAPPTDETSDAPGVRCSARSGIMAQSGDPANSDDSAALTHSEVRTWPQCIVAYSRMIHHLQDEAGWDAGRRCRPADEAHPEVIASANGEMRHVAGKGPRRGGQDSSATVFNGEESNLRLKVRGIVHEDPPNDQTRRARPGKIGTQPPTTPAAGVRCNARLGVTGRFEPIAPLLLVQEPCEGAIELHGGVLGVDLGAAEPREVDDCETLGVIYVAE